MEELDLSSDSLNPNASPDGVAEYTEDSIRTLDAMTHIRTRPGMYIGNLGDGTAADDGIYVLLKEVIDNSIDEFMMGFGKKIVVDIVDDREVTVRDYGRGIPPGSLVAAASIMNTSGKFDDEVFKRSIGLNGVGIKAVNALSSEMVIRSIRNGLSKTARFEKGVLINETDEEPTDEPNGTYLHFVPDETLFKNYQYRNKFIEPLLKNYTYLNTGLTIIYNGVKYVSKDGLEDLLLQNMTSEPLYPIIHLKGKDIEIALTHANQYGEEYYSFVNSQNTTQGGTHLAAFKESVSRTLKDYFQKNFEYSDIRNGIVAAIAIKVQDPIFESQTKTKLHSRDIGPEGKIDANGDPIVFPTVAKFVGDFVKKELDDYLHRNLEVADRILKKIQESERNRKAMAGVAKLAREKAKKTSLHNRKLIDCNVHFNDTRGDQEKILASSIFLTEGDSAGGSMTKARDPETQAVFMLRGKPLNTFGATQKILYKNEEFNLLQAALNIEDGLDGLRYNNVIIATDADVDGMHIRLLLITFFLHFFPELIKKGHLYVLQTPLFRVRNRLTSRRKGKKDADKAKDDAIYCYSDEERLAAIAKFGANAEITRFKGLGEISPDEFKGFIGSDMRIDPVTLRKEDRVEDLLEFYMGKNTFERQGFIINNLVIEDDSEIS